WRRSPASPGCGKLVPSCFARAVPGTSLFAQCGAWFSIMAVVGLEDTLEVDPLHVDLIAVRN
ncbi:unnamed protein product, partial [Ectocarpus sp. 6 AP-2014]